MKAIEITGIWLTRKGGENDPNAEVQVHVEVDGNWRRVITEPLGANFSHAVSSDGIRSSPLSDCVEQRATCSRGAEIGESLGIVP